MIYDFNSDTAKAVMSLNSWLDIAIKEEKDDNKFTMLTEVDTWLYDYLKSHPEFIERYFNDKYDDLRYEKTEFLEYKHAPTTVEFFFTKIDEDEDEA